MTNVVLTLGGVPLRDMEVPEAISFGGKQRLAVQDLLGGGRVVQALGLDDGLISFSGIFSGADAVARAQYFDGARAIGAAIPLVWDQFFYIVVIQSFSAEYRKNILIPFNITCAVVSDPLANLAIETAAVFNLVSEDLSSAAGLSGQAGLSSSLFSGNSISAISNVQGTIASIINQTSTSIVLQANVVNQTTAPILGAASMLALVESFGQSAAASQMQGYLGRAATNLTDSLL
jgi:hypothetical protein